MRRHIIAALAGVMLAGMAAAFDASPMLGWVLAGGAAEPAFSPLDIADCVSWMDGADTSKMYDAVSGGSLVANNGDIARWVDKSTAGNNWTNSGANPQRIDNVQNGKSAVYFEGTDFMIAPNTANTNGTAFLVFNPLTDTGYLLFKSTTTATSYYFWSLAGNSGAAQAVTLGYPTFYKNGTGISFSNATSRDTAYQTFSNQWSVVSISGAKFATSGPFVRIGDNIYPLTGYIAESLIYNRVLSAEERGQIEAYLMDKWGI